MNLQNLLGQVSNLLGISIKSISFCVCEFYFCHCKKIYVRYIIPNVSSGLILTINTTIQRISPVQGEITDKGMNSNLRNL